MHQIHQAHYTKCSDSSGDIHMVLLQICSTPLGQGLHSLAMLLFNHPVGSVMPVINRKSVSVDNDDEHHIKINTMAEQKQHKQ